jgi:hypothetical protein
VTLAVMLGTPTSSNLTQTTIDRIIHISQQGAEMQALINLSIVMLPVIIMGVAMIIMGEF